jgi:predicted nuclease with TOPRIM domain
MNELYVLNSLSALEQVNKDLTFKLSELIKTNERFQKRHEEVSAHINAVSSYLESVDNRLKILEQWVTTPKQDTDEIKELHRRISDQRCTMLHKIDELNNNVNVRMSLFDRVMQDIRRRVNHLENPWKLYNDC